MGLLAQAVGASAEELAEVSFRRYAAEGLAVYVRCYPPSKTIYNGTTQRKQTFLLPEEGPPDYCLCLQGGRLLWLEIKTWAGRNLHTERKRMNQHRQMMEAIVVGGLGAYLVAWRPEGEKLDWRLYPVEQLEFTGNSLVFRREAGCAIASPEGWPAWWSAVAGQ